MDLRAFLARTWDRYRSITPDAGRVHALLESRGERIINDHVAYRTFDLPGISRLEIGALFEPFGYERREDLDFPEKKLKATYWIHPDPALPKIFVSELLLEQVSPALRAWIQELVAPARARKLSLASLLEPSWAPPSFEDYQRFYPESEYASWTAAFGIQANHFTVFVNELKSFDGIASLNAFLQSSGFELNASGGIIKGTAREGLEQSSTLARRVPWSFAGGESREIMSCYYEFAYRHPLEAGGPLFQGFVPKSADRIFESTFERQS